MLKTRKARILRVKSCFKMSRPCKMMSMAILASWSMLSSMIHSPTQRMQTKTSCSKTLTSSIDNELNSSVSYRNLKSWRGSCTSLIRLDNLAPPMILRYQRYTQIRYDQNHQGMAWILLTRTLKERCSIGHNLSKFLQRWYSWSTSCRSNTI